MKTISLFSAVIICSLFFGCPYDTSIPIDEPSVKVNENLLGTWKSASSDDDKYKIEQLDEFRYKIEKKSKGSEPENYIAFISNVNNASFLNINRNSESADAPEYYLYKIEFNGDGVFTLKELTENIDEEFSNSADLKKFISENMQNSYFYSKDEEIYTKTK